MHPGHKCWKTSFSIVLMIAISKLVDGALGRLHDDLKAEAQGNIDNRGQYCRRVQ